MLQIRTQTFNLAGPAGGYSLIGNPYAAQVNMDEIMASGVGIDKGKYYMYDPYLNIDQGGYLTYTADINGVYSSTPPSPGGQTNILQSSQAFYVERTSATATVTFTEASKSNSLLLGLFRPLSTARVLTANLYLVNTDNSLALADGIKVQFDGTYSNDVDHQDAGKFGNIHESLALVRDTEFLAVESRRQVVLSDTLFLHLANTSRRRYQFQFAASGLDTVLTAFLEDAYTGTKTPLSMTSSQPYNFNVNGDEKSYAANRFRILLHPAASGPLPVTFSRVKAWQQGDDIKVEWMVENEINIAAYEVEKSTDATNFIKVNITNASRSTGDPGTYHWLDQQISTGNNYYRIRSIGTDGTIAYSSVVLVTTPASGPGFSIYPNPVITGIISIKFKRLPGGLYTARLVNSEGKTVLSRSISHSLSTTIETLRPGKTIMPGIYQLQLTGPGKRIKTIKVIIQ